MSIQFAIDTSVRENEDRHRTIKYLGKNARAKASYAYIGLYDGYDGADCAEYVKKHLSDNIVDADQFHRGNIKKGIEEAYLTTDERFLAETKRSSDISGCSAVTALISFQATGRKLFVANLGDSKAMLCKKGKPQMVSAEHVPSDYGEKARLVNAGAEVVNGKLMSVCNVSRAFGSKQLKKHDGGLIATPFVYEHILHKEDEYLVLATGPFWHYYDADSLARRVPRLLETYHYNIKRVCAALIGEAHERGCRSDVTVSIILLDPPKEAGSNDVVDVSDMKWRHGSPPMELSAVERMEAKLGRPLSATERMDLADGKMDGEYFGQTIGNAEERREEREERERLANQTHTLSAMERLDMADGKMDGQYFGEAIGQDHSHRKDKKDHDSKDRKDHQLTGIRVTVHDGKVKDGDIIGKGDPYVMLQVGEEKNKTTTKESTVNPEWHETFDFRITEKDPILKLEVWDKDKIGKDDHLGSGTLALSALQRSPDGVLQNVPVHLMLKGKPSGTINVSVIASWKIKEEVGGSAAAAKKVTSIMLTVASGRGIKTESLMGLKKAHHTVTVSLLPTGASDDSWTTKPAEGDDDPQWNETNEFHVRSKDAFKIAVHDKETLIGEIQVPFQELGLQHGKGHRWIPIFKKQKNMGEILIRYDPHIEGHRSHGNSPTAHGHSARSRPARQLKGIKVTIQQASNLKKTDIIGKSDPYVEVKAGQHKWSTKCIKGTQDPIWNEAHIFDVHAGHARDLQFIVKDRDTAGRDDIIGTAVIPLPSVDSHYGNKTITINSKKGKGTGQLAINLEPVYSSGTSPMAHQSFHSSHGSNNFHGASHGTSHHEDGHAAHKEPHHAAGSYSGYHDSDAHHYSSAVHPPEHKGPSMGKIVAVRVGVLECNNLPKGNMMDHTDPYVRITTRSDNWKTSFQKNTTNPVWHDESHIFDMHDDHSLEVVVMDKDVLKDDVVCSTTIPLRDIESWFDGWSGTNSEKVLPLFRKGKQAGTVRLHFSPQFAASHNPKNYATANWQPASSQPPADGYRNKQMEMDDLRRQILAQQRRNGELQRHNEEETARLREEIQRERSELNVSLEQVKIEMVRRERRGYSLDHADRYTNLTNHASAYLDHPTSTYRAFGDAYVIAPQPAYTAAPVYMAPTSIYSAPFSTALPAQSYVIDHEPVYTVASSISAPLRPEVEMYIEPYATRSSYSSLPRHGISTGGYLPAAGLMDHAEYRTTPAY